ncbi:MAG: hypothetical protein U5N53_31965 [Mycobacterium sp.]|nr:hypothetical protein [Mycobacterium sp.]
MPRQRPVIAVLCENVDDRPPGLENLDVDFRFCTADGLSWGGPRRTGAAAVGLLLDRRA